MNDCYMNECRMNGNIYFVCNHKIAINSLEEREGLPECCSMISRFLVKWYCCLRSTSGLGKAEVRQSFSGKVVFIALHCKSLQKDSLWPQAVFYEQFRPNCVLLEED
jgi:hypothetical protein